MIFLIQTIIFSFFNNFIFKEKIITIGWTFKGELFLIGEDRSGTCDLENWPQIMLIAIMSFRSFRESYNILEVLKQTLLPSKRWTLDFFNYGFWKFSEILNFEFWIWYVDSTYKRWIPDEFWILIIHPEIVNYIFINKNRFLLIF